MRKILLVFTILLTLISLISCEMEDTNNNKLDEITFGYYPQTLVKDQDILSNLMFIEPDENNVVLYNNTKYLKLEDNYYEFVNIEWERVKVGNKDLYITKQIIDQTVFLREEYVKVIGNSESTKPGVPQGTYSNNYEYSDLREWLNNEFMSIAFSSHELEKLDKIEYDNLSDYIYTLSSEEIENLTTPAAKVTEYAKAKGCDVFTSLTDDTKFNGNGFSWLRDANLIHRYRVYGLSYEGLVYEYVDCYYKGIGVRPVISFK